MNHQFLAYVLGQPWALRPETIAAYAAVLGRRYARKAGVELAPQDDAPSAGVVGAAAPRPATGRSGAIAVIPVCGTIVQRANQLDLCEGGTSTQQISAMLSQALADETVGAVLLEIDSPGGSVYGVSELADEIRAARSVKPVVAVANSLAASAAYWLGCAAGEFYCTPGGEVGSIGVWSAHEDVSKALDAVGVKVSLISAGAFKTEGNPYTPLDEEARRFMQSRVDDYYAMFTSAVAKGRSVPVAQVRSGMGQGRVLGAEDALSQKMVDGVMTFAEVVKKMQRDMRSARTASASVEHDLPGISADSAVAPIVEPIFTPDPAIERQRASAARARSLDLSSL